MSHNDYHLAQFNIIKLKDHLDSPIVKEFKDFLGPVNQLAEESPGFIWRLKDESSYGATDLETPYQDELIFINMSVWLNYEYLKTYTYQTVHSYFLKSRKKWSSEIEGHTAVMWYLEAGKLPSVHEAKSKLDFLNQFGSSEIAFSMTDIYNFDGTKLDR
ncbi:DUF3291 domain-containing protein [Arenibacter sp. ARW7G5Y1]|uniref:DUF3291 domain-containing protein n=1 Tax=Arenibacter sp. ARW7G5Y1 TaxID=2135619 RepID=UPI000D75E409|nr:DUF3291 domain-containing protein [Arenibacter sp. ARW7G5Y1]PXX25760.1 uncharacterized protein DUF3291 [Arenibacter sp. ARW7G5Y1]|tara:strand:+ start:805 stop:1281 length:477 start_codon:yes stop_codon:yes gene_type:complete